MPSSQIEEVPEAEVAGFISKTYQILDNEDYSRIIYWGCSGREFVIKDISKFQEVVLPKFFRHSKINSFIRQLNMYGFHKSRKDNAKSIFSHPSFLKGRDDLLPSIKRKIKSIESPVSKTPTKARNMLEPKMPETAIREPEHSPSQIIPKEFLESCEHLHSRFNLNFSLKNVSLNDFDRVQGSDDDEQVSIQNAIQGRKERQQLKSDLNIILNPSCFFGSFREHH